MLPSPRHLPLYLCLSLLLPCCDVASTGGLGIGVPAVVERTPTARLPVRFGRLYLPDGLQATGQRYVELINDGATAVDLRQPEAALLLASEQGSVPLPAVLWQPGQVVRLGGDALAPLGLHRHAGQLALLDQGAALQAYGAWGVDGLSLLGGLAKLAQQSGFATAGTGPLPFPLRQDLALLLQAGAPAFCTSAQASLTPPYPAAPCEARAGALAPQISRVVPGDVDDDGASLELYNPDPSEAIDPYGLTLCTRSAGCAPIFYRGEGDAAMAAVALEPSVPATTQARSRRRLGLRGARPLQADDLMCQLLPVQADDELVLLPPGHGSSAAATAADALCYLRLATTAQAPMAQPTPLLQRLADPALQHAWLQAAAPAPRLEGEAAVLMLDAAAWPPTPASWRLGNVADPAFVPLQAAPYQACSLPLAPAQPVLQLQQARVLSVTEAQLVLGVPEGGPALDCSQLTLALGAAAMPLIAMGAPASLVAGATLWINVSTEGACAAPHDACWPQGPQAPLQVGELSVLQAGATVLHVQWGPPQASHRGALGAAAGVWPQPACRVAAFSGQNDGTRLLLLPQRAGQSPADYAVDF